MASIEVEHIDHPLIEENKLEQRDYQTELAEIALSTHTLICLPTGLGKTTISLLVTADRLTDQSHKSLLLAPTKPLVEQHATFYRDVLKIDDDKIRIFTGEVQPSKREDLWEGSRIVVATPQVIENDLIGNRISLNEVVHLTFDECHRASGDYPYTYIADQYHASATDPLVTGMSASPGDDEESILNICDNLGIEQVEVRTEEDPEVKKYTHHTDFEWQKVELPETVTKIRDNLNAVIKERLTELKELGVVNTTQPDISQSQLNQIQTKLQQLIDEGDSSGFEGMSLHAEIMKLRHGVELVETQSIESLRRYFERQQNKARSSGASKASQRFISDPRVQEAIELADEFDEIHPKFRKTRMLIAETLGIEDGERVIVFTESRDTAETLTGFLDDHFSVTKFVGQNDTETSEGMTQKQQKQTLDKFRSGSYDVLVSTSVAEEGLDIPDVDLVLFYEPVPTAIRSIQRKGRTGRQTTGKVRVLIAEDTRDEAYFWMSKQREEKMEQELRSLKEIADDLNEDLSGEQQPTLDEFNKETRFAPKSNVEEPTTDSKIDTPSVDGAGDTTEIVIDQRELDSSIARTLSQADSVSTRLETLEVADYILSDRVAVERKTVADFVDSLISGDDRSLFDQIGDLSRNYHRPVLIIEGEELYSERNVHPNAIQGTLSSIIADFGVSILQTADMDETADLLQTIAQREQEETNREISVHGEKASKTLAEQQEYVISSIADVGPVTARSLLEEFGSVETVLTADKDELTTVEGVGEITASRIREVVGSEYVPD